MRWWKIASVIVLGATVTQAGPKKGKKPDPWLDVPSMTAAGSPTEKSVLTVECTQVPGAAPRRVSCKTTQAMITGPLASPELATKRADLDQLEKAKAHLAKVLAGMCTKRALSDLYKDAAIPDEQTFVNKVKQACAKKDGSKLVDAMRWRLANVEAHECGLLALSYDVEFTQQDANTWTSTTTGWLCGATAVGTLWRNAGDRFWNYKQVRSVPPNADPRICGGLTQAPVEWRWDTKRTRELGCKYFRP